MTSEGIFFDSHCTVDRVPALLARVNARCAAHCK